MLHTGLCLLRLTPDSFWAMTPVEFFAAAGGMVPRAVGFSRDALAEMMARFPDGVG